MKTPKTKQQIEYEYGNKILLKQHQLKLRYDSRKANEFSKRDTYWTERYNKDLKKRERILTDKMEKELKNIGREEKGHKIVTYKKKVKKITKGKMLKLLQKYVRLRDSGPDGYGYCISSGARVHYKQADGGHYLSRKYNAVAFDLDNIHLQSKGDNQAMSGAFGMDKAKEVEANYRKGLVAKIGEERVKELELNKSTLVDTWQYLTHDTYEYWQAKVKELERTKTLSN